MNNLSFSDIVIVSCGTLSLELSHLKKTGFLNADQILYTRPGLHEKPRELERQLLRRIEKAKNISNKVIVIYGGKFCYVNTHEPTRTMKTIIEERGPGVGRIQATHCIDMLASQAERDRIGQEVASGQKVWWMTPGWIKFRHYVFEGWDQGLANENFPRHTGGAIVLDGLGYVERYMTNHPEDLLEYSDWMGIPIQSYPVTLSRLKSLLRQQAATLLMSDRLQARRKTREVK
jgi:hypothetical protein